VKVRHLGIFGYIHYNLGQDAPKMKTNQVQIELHVESVGYTKKEESY